MLHVHWSGLPLRLVAPMLKLSLCSNASIHASALNESCAMWPCGRAMGAETGARWCWSPTDIVKVNGRMLVCKHVQNTTMLMRVFSTTACDCIVPYFECFVCCSWFHDI